MRCSASSFDCMQGRLSVLDERYGFCRVLLLFFACGPGASPEPGVANIRAVVRTADDVVVSNGTFYVGSAAHAEPDLAGFLRYDDMPPGRLVILGSADGFADSKTTIQSAQGSSGVGLVTLLPTATSQVDVSTGGTWTDPDHVEFSWNGGMLFRDGSPAAGVADLRWAWVIDGQRTMPGDSESLVDDVTIGPVTLTAAVFLGAPSVDDELLTLADGGTLTFLGELPVDALLYSFDSSNGFWRELGPLVDGARTIQSFGWFAVGQAVAPTACVRGQLRDVRGRPLEGAEVEAVVPFGFAPHRGWSDSSGKFCVDLAGPAPVVLHVLGASPHGELMYHAIIDAGEAALGGCGGQCIDLGAVVPTPHGDLDQDGYLQGLGDCDDLDVGVNPSFALGDGSICAEPL